MKSGKIIYKEESSIRNKAVKFLILLVGDVVGFVCVLFIVEAFRANLSGWDLMLSYLIAGTFGVLLVGVIVQTWGFFHSHSEMRVTKSSMIKSFKIPPLVFHKKILTVGNIKSITGFDTNKIIYQNGVFVRDNIQTGADRLLQVVVKTKDGKEVLFETKNPNNFAEAIKEMFTGGRKK
jgi:hypothetical protein